MVLNYHVKEFHCKLCMIIIFPIIVMAHLHCKLTVTPRRCNITVCFQCSTCHAVKRDFSREKKAILTKKDMTISDHSQYASVHGKLWLASLCEHKGKGSPYSITERGWSRILAVSLHVTWVINLAVGCHYFPPGLQLPSQPLRGLLPILLLGEQRHNGCEQFA